jgi:hypothetical protein
MWCRFAREWPRQTRAKMGAILMRSQAASSKYVRTVPNDVVRADVASASVGWNIIT